MGNHCHIRIGRADSCCALVVMRTRSASRLTTLKPRIAILKSRPVKMQGGVDRLSDRSGSAWAKIRRSILSRDYGMCQPCKRLGRITMAAQVDHIVPLASGGRDNEDNLQAICYKCHEAKTKVDVAALHGRG